MTAEDLAELQQLLTARAVASRLRGNRADDHLTFATHLLESLRAANKPGVSDNHWGNITAIEMKNEGDEYRDLYGDTIAQSIFATHHTITFTYRA